MALELRPYEDNYKKKNYNALYDGRDPVLAEEFQPEGCCRLCCRRVFPSGFKTELKSLLAIAIPVIITNMCAFLILTESIILCGHLDTYELGAAGLANSFINALGLSVATGLATACDTFFSQIFGSPYKKKMGMFLQRSMMIMTLVPFIVVALFVNSEPLFILLGQDLRIANLASRYMTLFSPGMFFAFHYLLLARYMQNQDYVYPPMIICIVGNLFNVSSQYITIYLLGYGFDASPICQACTYVLMWLLEVVYIYFSKMYRNTWEGWSRDAFLDWGNFLSLGIPGVAMVVMETFCWEIGTFLAGLLGPVHLGTQSVIFQLESVTWQIAFGVSVAVNIRVGQSLGGMAPAKGLTAYRCGLAVMGVSSLVTGISFAVLHDLLPRLFTNDPEVIQKSSEILFVLMGVQFVDAGNTVTLGALRGCGRQRLGTLFIFCAYYLLGQPIGISLAFLTPLGVAGIWIGLLTALIIVVPPAMLVANRQDWMHQAELAQERIKSGTKGFDTTPMGHSDERTSLLAAEENADDVMANAGRHRRMPSQPRFPSLTVATIPMPSGVAREVYHKAYTRRAIAYAVAIAILTGAIFLRIYLPRESYLPIPTNNTVTPTQFPFTIITALAEEAERK